MKIYIYLLITFFLAFTPEFSHAGGSDGSEVLGKIKEDKNADKRSLLDAVKSMFGKNGDKSGNSGGNGKNGSGSERGSGNGNSSGSSSNDGSGDDTNRSPFDGRIMLDCVVTPDIDPDHIPLKNIKMTSNLIRKPGSATRANGQYIEIVGKVVDEDCLPVSDAVIQLWQPDSSGKYEDAYTPKSEWDIIDKDYDKNFGYSGTAQSNNVGEFSFLTILPGLVNNKLAPHINVTIEHPDFKNVNTMIFFDKHPRNDTDPNLKKLPEEKRDLLLAKGEKLDPNSQFDGRIYSFIITLEGMNKYRRY